nr:immunoglobulin heavy chain junction region [Macaca mulatta]MOX58750.1 immunoglobulin heavy chain junction region [Macaca mulatta]MOX59105.1 immunoglobulin heavy chain junction region [Macaca mulatta]MOX59963.1 immunoglobulin heavy chain junction region [Macaca mulatta]MOX59997.1 immunoglobulin heavy chain junction region [Macaca mulatta]
CARGGDIEYCTGSGCGELDSW